MVAIVILITKRLALFYLMNFFLYLFQKSVHPALYEMDEYNHHSKFDFEEAATWRRRTLLQV